MGAVEYAEKHDDKAIPLLLEVVKQFEALNFSHPYALSAHAYLVELYERQGKRDESTAHCIAIGKMRPWADAQEQQPIFRTAPDYPMSYAQRGKSGWVQLKFTVDENGFVKNPEILASKGGALFEKLANHVLGFLIVLGGLGNASRGLESLRLPYPATLQCPIQNPREFAA